LSSGPPRTKFAALEDRLGYTFHDGDLLVEALTHKSFYHENADRAVSYNERLEFLGDSVVGLAVVEYLFRHPRGFPEAVLAKLKSYLVCEAVFCEVALSIGLNSLLLLGKGEEATGGRQKKSILADAFEAMIGAVYLDGGFERTRDVILRLFRDRIERVIETGEFYDFKTELQEMTQSLCGCLPEYRVLKQQGEDHERIFTVAVFLEGRHLGTASGRRKKEAESLAAREALGRLRQEG
jgi:ribonuclease-3